jgi:hypothetical protein
MQVLIMNAMMIWINQSSRMFSDEKKKYALQCRQYQRLPRALNRHR